MAGLTDKASYIAWYGAFLPRYPPIAATFPVIIRSLQIAGVFFHQNIVKYCESLKMVEFFEIYGKKIKINKNKHMTVRRYGEDKDCAGKWRTP